MTEEEARDWIASHPDVSRETSARFEHFRRLLVDANRDQNLIAQSTVDHIWTRHIADSLQLVSYLDKSIGSVMDLGSGPGLPGIVLAAARQDIVLHLVESRAKRCEFLRNVVSELSLTNVDIHSCNVSTLDAFAVGAITARAFAPLPKLIALARPFSTPETRWILPRGVKGVMERDALSSELREMFHVEHSVTDDEAVILVGEGIS